MVNLLEYEGKRIFKKYNLPVPKSYVIKSTNEIKNIDKEVVVKAQVPIGHRGSRGGVIKVNNRIQAKNALNKIKNISFNGFKAESFLIEEAVKHDKEIYLGLTLDRSKRSPVLIVSSKGGVDIESVPNKEIAKFYLDILIGIPDYVKRLAFNFLGLKESYRNSFYSIVEKVWSIFTKEDCELVEINPLAANEDSFIALDSKVIIEDDSLFRHKEYIKETVSNDPIEKEARSKNISFVRLDGNIGLIANGAGLTLATIDLIKRAGGNAGDFLDLGGTDDPEKVAEAINLVKKEKPTVLFINIFGGVTKADTVAEGIVKATKDSKEEMNLIVRLKGVNDEKGKEILNKNGIEAFTDLSEAIRKVVEVSKK